MKYLTTDLRPVFSEERLILEFLLGKKPNEYLQMPVWASNNRYYIDGKTVSLSNQLFKNTDTEHLRSEIKRNSDNIDEKNTCQYYNYHMKMFLL